MDIARYIDHTLLKAQATVEEIKKLAEEARKYQFASVCVNPVHVKLCKSLLENSPVKVCTVIGFPLGANTSKVKAFETATAIAEGADEVDMVINIGAIKDGNWELVEEDVKAVVESANGKLVKVILECCLLSKEEIERACIACVNAGADYVKTSTGFSTGGALVEDVRLMKETVKDKKVKASGGVRSIEDAQKMIAAGASRIGTSNGVKIVSGEKVTEGY